MMLHSLLAVCHARNIYTIAIGHITNQIVPLQHPPLCPTTTTRKSLDIYSIPLPANYPIENYSHFLISSLTYSIFFIEFIAL